MSCSPLLSPSNSPSRIIKDTVSKSRQKSTFASEIKMAELDKGSQILVFQKRDAKQTLSEETLYQGIVQESDWIRYQEKAEDYSRQIEKVLGDSGFQVLKNYSKYGLVIFRGPLVDGQFDERLGQLPLPLSMVFEFQDSETRSLKLKAATQKEDFGELSSDWNYFAGTGLPKFFEAAQNDLGFIPSGKSIKIGIVDSGVSFAHPAFRDPETGKTRIRKIFETTLEGSVGFFQSQTSTVTPLDDSLRIYSIRGDVMDNPNPFTFAPLNESNRQIDVSITASPELEKLLKERASELRVGWIEESRYQSLEGFNDLNRNGRIDDHFLVLLFGVDPLTSVAYIDFEGKLDFNAQPSLTEFNQSGATRKLGYEKVGYSLEVQSNGYGFSDKIYSFSLVGLDPSAHGTHVASVAAGASFVRGLPLGKTPLRGLAARSEIYVVRSIRSNGVVWGSYDGILKLADENVDWINLSFAGLSEHKDNSTPGVLPELLSRLTREKNIRFVLAAGNEGPGAQSLSTMASATGIITVAGLIHPELVKTTNEDILGGSTLAQWMPLSFSSRGPGPGFSFHPQISAPGILLAAAPLSNIALNHSAYSSLMGTSMAAPFVTGLLALLDESARELGVHPLQSKSLVIQSMNEGAQTVRGNGYSWHDTGHGLFRVDRSYEILKSAKNQLDDSIERFLFTQEKSNSDSPQNFLKDSLYMKVSQGEKKCQDIWLHRQARRGLSAAQLDEVKEAIATSLETLQIQFESYGIDTSFIEFRGIDGADPTYWKILGNGVDELDLSEASFQARPENRLQICVDGAKKPPQLQGLRGFLLKLYKIDSDSGLNSILPAAELPITLEFDSNLDEENRSSEVIMEIPHPLGVQQNFTVPKNTLYAAMTLRMMPEKNRCATIEAVLLSPLEDTDRQGVFDQNIDSLSSCGPRPQIQFELTKPTAGRWALGLRSRINNSDFAKVAAQFRYYQGTVEALDNSPENDRSFRWLLKPESSPLAQEEIGAQFVISGWEGSGILTGLGNAQNATKNPQAYTCFAPNNDTRSLKVVSNRNSSIDSSSYFLELLECPTGVTNPEDPLCSVMQSIPSINGQTTLETNTSWGQNYCIKISSLKKVEISYKIQSTISVSSINCEITPQTSAPISPSEIAGNVSALATQKIECPRDLKREASGSEIGPVALGKVEVFLKRGHRIIYRSERRISK